MMAEDASEAIVAEALREAATAAVHVMQVGVDEIAGRGGKSSDSVWGRQFWRQPAF
jgi:hypothetical protein